MIPNHDHFYHKQGQDYDLCALCYENLLHLGRVDPNQFTGPFAGDHFDQ